MLCIIFQAGVNIDFSGKVHIDVSAKVNIDLGRSGNISESIFYDVTSLTITFFFLKFMLHKIWES